MPTPENIEIEGNQHFYSPNPGVPAITLHAKSGHTGPLIAYIDAAGASEVRDAINAFDYGAKGDGVTDDTTSLQAFFTATSTLSRSGYLPKGTYLTTATLTVPSNSHVIGDPGVSIIKAAASHTGIVLQNLNPSTGGNNNITLENFVIDGNTANRTAPGKSNLVITATTGTTVSGTCTNITIRSVESKNSPAIGIALQNARDSRVIECYSHDHARDGITFYFDSQGCSVIGNHVRDCGDDLLGFNSEGGTMTGHVMRKFTIAGNVLGGGGTSQGCGIALRGITDSVITGNVIDEAFAAGIVVSNFNTNASRGLEINSNIITNAGINNSGGSGSGIELDGTSSLTSAGGSAGLVDISIQDNYIYKPRAHGIVDTSGDASGTIVGLNITNNRLVGHTLYASSRGINLSAGRGSRITIKGNYISAFQIQGIYVSNQSNPYDDVEIIQNRTYDSATSRGIQVEYATNVRIIGNRSTDTRAGGSKTQTYGLWLNALGSVAFLRDNDFSGNLTGDVNYVVSGDGTNYRWQRRRVQTPEQFLMNGESEYRESFPWWGIEAASLALSTGVGFVTALPLFAGDVVTDLSFTSGSTALTRGSTNGTAHLWAALYDPTLTTVMSQSTDEGDAAAWASNTVKTFTLGAAQTITTTGVYYTMVMVNAGTGGSPATPTVKGKTNGGVVLSPGLGTQKARGGTNGSSLAATAPTGPLSLGVASGTIPYVVARP
jgi:hypothetical protein